MSESMVERVARHFNPKAWTLQPKTPLEEKAIAHWKHVARLKARAAIAEMREPNDSMIDAAVFAADDMNGPFFCKLWEAAIDAALSTPDS